MSERGWIGVDLDGTLAHYENWVGLTEIGAPVPAMVDRVKRWIENGERVKIFTARIMCDNPEDCDAVDKAVRAWCKEHIGVELEVTCIKDFAMIELWDDRAVAVEANTGRQLNPSRRGL